MSDKLEETLEERGNDYGDYGEMSEVVQQIKDTLRDSIHYGKLGYRARESLDMIATKMARIVVGGDKKEDNWLDIAGYAQLNLEKTK